MRLPARLKSLGISFYKSLFISFYNHIIIAACFWPVGAALPQPDARMCFCITLPSSSDSSHAIVLRLAFKIRRNCRRLEIRRSAAIVTDRDCCLSVPEHGPPATRNGSPGQLLTVTPSRTPPS